MGEDSSVPVGNVDPESGELSDDHLADIRAALASESPLDRQHGARTCSLVAEENAETLGPVVDDLAALLDDDNAAVVQQAVTAMLGVARQRPDEVTDYVPTIVSLTDHEVNSIKLLAARLFGAVVVDRPEAGASEIDRLFSALRERPGSFDPSEGVDMVEDQETRQTMMKHEQEEHRMVLQTQGTLANALVAIAEGAPSVLFDHVDDLVDLLDHRDASIAGTAVDALAEAAQADPGVAAPAFDDLVELLDHDDQRVRVRTVRALGFLGDDRAVEPLRDLSDSESNEDLAELATDTAEFLEDD